VHGLATDPAPQTERKSVHPGAKGENSSGRKTA
jgi:hypothetical protein